MASTISPLTQIVPFEQLIKETDAANRELKRFPIRNQLFRDRYPDVTPFAFNQVRIEEKETNGSWIFFQNPQDDPERARVEYIAICAPLRAEFCNFYRLIFQKKIQMVVMLTELKERNTIKANDYLPEVKEILPIDDTSDEEEPTLFHITLSKLHDPIPLSQDEEKEDALIQGMSLEQRDIQIHSLDQSQNTHEFRHFHVRHWPDYQAGNLGGIIKLIQHLAAYQKEQKITSPILCHCSAGLGRSGITIAADYMWKKITLDKPVDVYSDIAFPMRLQRLGLGGRKEQYLILYKIKEAQLALREIDRNMNSQP